MRQRFAFADSLLDFTALSNALGVNTPSRTPNDPIRPPTVSLDHLHCFLPIAYAHQAIVGELHADGVRGLIDDFRGCVIQERTAGQDERKPTPSTAAGTDH